MSNSWIDVTIRIDISPTEKTLIELLQASSRIGLAIMMLGNAQKKIPASLQAIYKDADAKLKAALMDGLELPGPITNLAWDTKHFLTDEEHLVILAPEG